MSHVFVTGDTHGDMQIGRLSSKAWPEGKELNKQDYVIITGDFGLLWTNNLESKEGRTEKYWMKWLIDKPWTTLFVDGNHENHFRLNNLPIIEKFGGKVGQVNDSVFHLKRGEIYTIHNKIFFCYGGAYSRDIAYRKLGVSYWEEEIPSYRESQYAVEQLQKINYTVDYVITHTAPDTLISMSGIGSDYLDPTTRFLEFLAKEMKYERWFCGHLHMDKDIAKFSILWDRIVQIF